ncbi:hypothetical protein MARA_01520 (plasmid) [Mycolicibacterium arabiense]|uniref:Uncharacterized protein n=1 Tax=Mycolicibacterium arabiense TaxID=1286181 RepID=A0A7I7RQ68_9MYCO|nr:hypothetical protein MARA_01520 [Mycolicibacterium arabiense]
MRGRTDGLADAAPDTGLADSADSVVGEDLADYGRVRVPADGWCLLYSVLVSAPPQLLPSEVWSDAGAERAAILAQLSGPARLGARAVGGSPQASPLLRRAAVALRDVVRQWVAGRDRLPDDVVAQFRRSESQMGQLRTFWTTPITRRCWLGWKRPE